MQQAQKAPYSPPTIPVTTAWDWRYTLLYLSVAIVEILWFAPFVQMTIRSPIFDDPIPMNLDNMMALVGGNLLAALIVRRVLIRRRMVATRQRLILLLAMALGLLVSISVLPILTDQSDSMTFDYLGAFDVTRPILPEGFIILPLIVWVHTRGASIGRSSLEPVGVGIMMRLAIMMFFLTAIFSYSELQEEMLAIMPLFFAAMLMASALSRSNALKLDADVREQRFGLPWFGFLSSITVVVTAIGFVLSLLLAGIDRDQGGRAFEIILTFLLTLIFIIASPFLYVANIFFNWLSEALSGDTPAEQELEGGGEREVVPGGENEPFELGETLQEIIAFATEGVVLICVLGVIAVIVIFWLVVFFSPQDDRFVDEDSESIDERENIRGLGKALMKRLQKLGDWFGLVGQYGIGRDLFGALTIRWAYARMERMGNKRGFPRGASQTPYEYRHLLAQAFPGGQQHIRTITNAYVAVRYGEVPEDRDQLDAVRGALDRLKEIPAPNPPGN
ncbi:MAG: DUF4129 domain-containing protein [Chloroflexi bacterium]|nr:DUF4129 domain-containing protein [Chloroflexota bacterium]